MSQIQQLLTKHLDIWTAAETEKKSGRGRASGSAGKVYGIQKLRSLILDLAVCGRLVQPIGDSKTESIKHIKLGQLVDVLDSLRKPVTKQDRTQGAYPYYGASGIVDFVSNYIFDEPLVLVGEDGAKWGKAENTAFMIEGKTWVNNHAHVIRPKRDLVIDKYLTYCLNAMDLSEFITGITVPKLNQAKLVSIDIPLPSTEEQHRIVAKVDELMALCDQLEQQHSNAAEAHEKLVEHLLATLSQAQNAQDFNSQWQRIYAHFDTLFTTEASINVLKQTLLQLAVIGKLVPQNPNNETASELLKRIQAEKAKLVTEGKLKKEKPLATISDDKKPFVLPKGWEWAFIPQVISNEKYSIKRGPFGSSIQKSHFVPTGYKVYEQQHAINDDFSLGRYYLNEDKFNELKAFAVKPKDIIISCSGTVGKVAIAPDWMEPGLINQALLKLTLNEDILRNAYFKILFPAFYMKTDTLSDLKGTAQKNMVSVEELKNEPFPLPPLAEQDLIIIKVDELMALCDQLKTRIQQASQQQQKLADVLVEQALN